MALDAVIKPHQLIASDRVEGTAVRRPNGDMIGHIERLMIDKVSGQVSYAVMSSGGFLGMGARLLPLPWGRLRIVRASKPTNSTSMRTNCGARRRSARTRISIGAIGRRRRNCTATTASRLIGAASEVCVPPARRRPRPPAQRASTSKPNPWYPDHAPWVSATKDQLKGMPEFSPWTGSRSR